MPRRWLAGKKASGQIRQELKNARKALEGIPYRIGRKVLPHIMHY